MSQIFLLVQISPPLWVRERLLMSRSKIGRKRRGKILQNRRGGSSRKYGKDKKRLAPFPLPFSTPRGLQKMPEHFLCLCTHSICVFECRGGGEGGGRDWYVFFVSLGNRNLRFSFSSSLLFLCAQKKTNFVFFVRAY